MKKCLTWLVLISVLLVCSMAAAEERIPPVFAWERDLHTHWQLDAAKQPIHTAEHTLDDMMVCTVCGSEIWDFGDGSGDVNNYDEQGNLLRYTSFAADGTIISEISHHLTYDENGVLVLDLEFVDGVFLTEYVYQADADGNAIPVTQTAYFDDGTVSVNEYDEYGNCVRSASYEADGSLSAETLTEYAMGDDGWYHEYRIMTRFADGATFFKERNQYGDATRTINTEADGTVWLDHVYEYEYADGVKLWSKTYSNGVLVAENFYDAEGCNTKDIEYLEDGSCIVYTYDENGDTTETVYDAAGNPVE